ncbi:MAG: hypothetical protein KAG34_10205 [Cocleimonas sp.]|nr:hypothetical protein [Cocleimonas sp.]
MKNTLTTIILPCMLALNLASCSQYESTVFAGDYRYYSGIGEFFDCKTGVKYYLGKQGVNKELKEKYLALKLDEKDDVYLNVEGYLMEESPEDTLIPSTIFIATEFISFDTSRGCEVGRRVGH